MQEQDILEVLLDKIRIVNNGSVESTAGLLLTVIWHYRRENVDGLVSVTTLNGVSNNYTNDLTDAPYMEKILFKEARRGESFFTFDLSLVKNPSRLSKIFGAIIQSGAKSISVPYIGDGMRAIVKELSIDEKEMIPIATGRYEIPAGLKEIKAEVKMLTPQEIIIDNSDFDDPLSDDESNMDEIVIKKDVLNAVIEFQIRTL